MSTTQHRANRVTIIGSGTMGSQIRMVSTLAGYDTTIMDISPQALQKASSTGESIVT